jgi:hypothetical protein
MRIKNKKHQFRKKKKIQGKPLKPGLICKSRILWNFWPGSAKRHNSQQFNFEGWDWYKNIIKKTCKSNKKNEDKI